MNMEEDQRPWADICPYLLDSIYNRLSSHVDGTHFGSVCKNWHQVHSHIALSNPRPVLISHAKLSSSDVIQVREGKRLVLQRRRESQIPYELAGEDIAILGMAGAWFFIKVRDAFLGWYNPLLRSPANYFSLPNPSWRFSTYDDHYRPDTVLKFAFSALPTALDSAILVVYGDSYLCMFRRENNAEFEQKTYDFSLSGKKGQTCLGVGYKDNRFFCLFEMGDMLIFSIDENETKMLLAATKPMFPEQLQRWDYLCVVAMVVAKKAPAANDRYHEVEQVIWFRLVTHWERDCEGSFRLVAVEENNNDGDDIEGNSRTTGLILVKDQLPLKRTFDIYYIHMLFALFSIVFMYSFSWIIFFLRNRLC
ncbi:unnamed protein product [Linum tenue]|uniref:DUF295 domain-containing protein n=1 Tax=Linum tenue TaxID=586396 RepID=A0AAV0NED3_9ROSI|nr:unnamed protein product [Linum tenue]